jgi:hypothetical protein
VHCPEPGACIKKHIIKLIYIVGCVGEKKKKKERERERVEKKYCTFKLGDGKM